jgi:hypothetical protein
MLAEELAVVILVSQEVAAAKVVGRVPVEGSVFGHVAPVLLVVEKPAAEQASAEDMVAR